MFIAEQVQRGASSTIEGAGWLQHCCEGNTITHQGTKTKKEGKRNSARIKEIAIFFPPPCSISLRCVRQKTFPQHNRFVIQKVPSRNNGAFKSGRRASGSLEWRSKIFCARSVKNIFAGHEAQCVYRSFRSQRGPFRFPLSVNSF